MKLKTKKPKRKVVQPASNQSHQTKLSRRTTKRTAAAQATKKTVWRDASGRFATPVYFDGKRYRSKTTGHVASFASRAAKPSAAAKRAKTSGKPVKIKARVKLPRKVAKPLKAKPRKPKKKAVKAPPKPPKTFISRIFGKDRDTLDRKLTAEDKARIKEAIEAIEEAKEEARRLKKPFGPRALSRYGYEYYELIASIEKMSPHDIYTLIASPR